MTGMIRGARRTGAWLLAMTMISLGGCGGGGGGGSPAPTPPAGSTGVTATVTGTTATGAALVGAAVEIRCAQGTASATSDAAGTYSLQLNAAQGPCMLSSTGGSSEAPRVSGPLHAVLPTLVAGTQIANVSPLTELQAARLFSRYPALVWDACCAAGSMADLITPANATAAQAAVHEELVTRLGMGDPSLQGHDWVGTAFRVGDALDRQLDVLDARLAAAGLSLGVAAAQLSDSGQIRATPDASPANCVPGLIAGYAGPTTDDLIPATQWVGAGGAQSPAGAPLTGVGGPGGGGVVVGEGGEVRQVNLTMTWNDGRRWTVLAPEGRATFVSCAYAGPALFSVTPAPGAQYFDAGLGRLVDLPADYERRSMVPSLTRNVGVTPFTEAAWRLINETPPRVADGRVGLTLRLSPIWTPPWNDVVKQAVAADQVGRALTDLLPASLRRGGGQQGTQTIDITRMPILLGPSTVNTPGALPDSDNGRYGAIISGFAQAGARHLGEDPSPALTIAQQWAEDLSDGLLDLRGGGQPLGGNRLAYTLQSLWLDQTASAVGIARATGSGSLAAADSALQMLRISLSQGSCATTETLQLQADGRLHVSRTATGRAPISYWIQGQRFAEMAIVAHGYPASTLDLIGQDRTQLFRLRLDHDCAAIAVQDAPVQSLAAPGGQTFVALRHATLGSGDQAGRALLRTSSGQWLDDTGAVTNLPAGVIDIAAADPALQSEYIDGRRFFALGADGSVSVYKTGVSGAATPVAGVEGAVQLANSGYAVFARTAQGVVYWLNPNEAGTQGDANFSLPAHPDALPQRLTGLTERACWIGGLSIVGCSGAVSMITETVYGTSTQGGRYLVDVAPAVEATTLARVWRTLGADAMAYQSSLTSQGTAGGDWYVTAEGQVLDASGQALAAP